MNSNPLCIHPFIAFVVNPGKHITPCCAWYHGKEYIGSITNKNIIDILSSQKMIDIKTKLINNQWPIGCSACYNKEKMISRSLRVESNETYGKYFENLTFDTRIRRLEFSGSNICNLACIQCNEYFSSRWTHDAKKLHGESYVHMIRHVHGESYVPIKASDQQNPELIIDNLKLLDLSELNTIHFKGGEPMLNSETLSILEYFDSLDLLKNINVIFTTNGTISDTKILNLLSKTKQFQIDISVDGNDRLNQYIRYHAPGLETMEDNIKKFAQIPVRKIINFHPTIMSYNIFNLIEMDNWFMNIQKQYQDDYTEIPVTLFQNILMGPPYLRVNVLSTELRNTLLEYYTDNLSDEQISRFGFVFKELKNQYSGDKIHNKWVEMTEKLEKIRNNSLLEIEPRFQSELVLR